MPDRAWTLNLDIKPEQFLNVYKLENQNIAPGPIHWVLFTTLRWRVQVDITHKGEFKISNSVVYIAHRTCLFGGHVLWIVCVE